MSTVSSPKSSPFCKIGLCSRHKPLKVMVLGQTGVGKTAAEAPRQGSEGGPGGGGGGRRGWDSQGSPSTHSSISEDSSLCIRGLPPLKVIALVVRFITRRYIGEYDPTLEKVYTFHTVMDNEMVYFEILDTAGQPHESECLTLEANIRWAEAFILMYSVTDKCSFDECNRLKFLINYNKRKRRLNSSKESVSDVPVVLVGNKIDQWGDRMVSPEDGQRRSKEIGCVCFHEISVRESIEQVWTVFRDVCQFWKVHTKFPKLKRSSSDIHSPEAAVPPNGKPSLAAILGRRWTEVELDEEEETSPGSPTPAPEAEADLPPFRGRASTDGHLLSRPRRWRYPPPATTPTSRQADRRMSISMRGNNASC